MMRTAVGWGIILSMAVCVAAALPACSNSILRNAAEAGLETILEEPLPTPTVTASTVSDWKPAAANTSAGGRQSAGGRGS